MIPQRDLSLLSNRLAQRGGRRIPEAVRIFAEPYDLRFHLVFYVPLRIYINKDSILQKQSIMTGHHFLISNDGSQWFLPPLKN